jgi:hypothetical protein
MKIKIYKEQQLSQKRTSHGDIVTTLSFKLLEQRLIDLTSLSFQIALFSIFSVQPY